MKENIQTLDEVKNKWIDCEHENWFEIVKSGWIFSYLDLDGNAVMVRNGYVNKFRNKPRGVEG